MKRSAIALAVAVFGAHAGVLEPTSIYVEQQQVPTADPQTVVRTWLECDECSSGERKAVVDLGARAVPILASVLQDGPPKERVDAITQHLRKRYAAMTEYAKTHTDAQVPPSEKEFVTRYLTKYSSRQRIQSARGLGAIGVADARNAADARAALDAALKLQLPPEVMKAVREARASLGK